MFHCLSRFPLFSRQCLLSLGLALLAAPLTSLAEPTGKPVVLPNLDFEKDLEGWKKATNGADMIKIISSGHVGKGVQINDDDPNMNARLTSGKTDATAGKTYEVYFYARNLSGLKGVGAFLAFYGQDGTRLEVDPGSAHHKDVGPFKEWTELKLNCPAPAGTVKVGVEIRSNKASVIKAEFDDFRIYQLP